jgi:hypothetical protein
MKRALRFGISIAGVGLVAISAQLALGLLDRSIEHIDRDRERLLALARARADFRDMNALERDAILADSRAELATTDAKLDDASIALESELHHYAGLMRSEDTPLLAAVDGARARWLGVDARVRAAALDNRDEALALSKLHRLDADWESVFDSLTRADERRLKLQMALVEQGHVEWVAWSVALSAAAAAFGFAFGRKPRPVAARIAPDELPERVRPHSQMRLIAARPSQPVAQARPRRRA